MWQKQGENNANMTKASDKIFNKVPNTTMMIGEAWTLNQQM
jgi:hypothetical protein